MFVSYQSGNVSRQMNEECGAYAYRIVKPYFDKVTQKIDMKNAEMEGKNNRIRQLEDKEIKFQFEVTQLRLEIASKDKLIKLLEDKDESTADHIKSLKQEIQFLTKSFEIQPEAKNLKQQVEREIIELNAKVSLTADKAIKCEAELDNQKEINHTNDQRFHQMQVEVKKSADIMSKEIEKKNSKGCIAKDSTGVHNVTMGNGLSFEVLCNPDIEGPGWTVIQQRIKGGVDFYRNWITYRNGFGDFWDGDFFLGLEKIHQLTNQQPHELYIHMKYFHGTTIFARYDDFAISGEDDQYRIKLGKFFGSDGLEDWLIFHSGMKFSTYDRDNDLHEIKNCAEYYNNGWWNNKCYYR